MKLRTGEIIKKERKKNKVRLKDISKNINRDTSYIAHFERGTRSMNFKDLAKVTKQLNLNTNDIITGYLAEQIKNKFGREKYFKKALEMLAGEM